MLEYPLTFFALHEWLDFLTAPIELKKALDHLKREGIIGRKNGFYFLAGRDFLVDKKLRSYCLSPGKFKKAIRVIKFLKVLPWIRGIAVYGSLSLGNTKPESDVDLFIIAEQGRIWSGRFFINSFLKFFNLRPDKKNSRDKICVSYFVAGDKLNLSSAISPDNENFYGYGTAQFIFIYEEDNIGREFFEANRWLKEKFPAWFPYQINCRRKIKSSRGLIKTILEKIAGVIPEKYFEKFQMFILPEGLKAMKDKKDKNESTDVIINRQMLKLHDSNRSRGFERNYKLKINHLINGQD
ncbi:MAG: nucleotidyltransferase domain-containing protein [Patescibacteria group bacterium]